MSYREIQSYVKEEHGVYVKTCWIAHVKQHHGLTRGSTHNRKGPERANPCPLRYWDLIEEALKNFGLI